MRKTLISLMAIAVISLACGGTRHHQPTPTPDPTPTPVTLVTGGFFRALKGTQASIVKASAQADVVGTPDSSLTTSNQLSDFGSPMGSAVLAANGQVVIPNGKGLDKYDPAKEVFYQVYSYPGIGKIDPRLVEYRLYPTICNLPDGKVAIFGGDVTEAGSSIDTGVTIYDPVSNSATFTPNVLICGVTQGQQFLLVDSTHLLIVGGRRSGAQPGQVELPNLDIAPPQLVDLTTMTTTLVAQDVQDLQLTDSCLIRAINGKIFLIGGECIQGHWDPRVDILEKNIYTFDLDTGFTKVGELPVGKAKMGIANIDFHTIGIYGGIWDTGNSQAATPIATTNAVELFDTETYNVTPDQTALFEARAIRNTFNMQNGLTLHLGTDAVNYDPTGSPAYQIWHDETLHTTGVTGNALNNQAGGFSVPLPNGLFLVVGGELKSPDSGIWYPTQTGQIYDPSQYFYLQYKNNQVPLGGTCQLSLTSPYVNGVTWSLEGQGQIDQNGLYTAPTTPEEVTSWITLVTATAQDDSTKRAIIQITLLQ